MLPYLRFFNINLANKYVTAVIPAQEGIQKDIVCRIKARTGHDPGSGMTY